jgi:type I restriction enzyme S subunit
MVMEKGYKMTEVGVIPEDWEIMHLGDLGMPIIGLTYKPSEVSEMGTLVLRSSNIKSNRIVFFDNVYVNTEVSDRVIVKEGDLLICVRNGSKQLIGKCALIDNKSAGYAFGAFMSVFRSPYNHYIFHQFQSRSIQRQIHERLGATINQITNRDLNEFIIPFSNNPEELNKIAEALSDMDALISQTERLIEKKKAIKQGMMQELLTPKEGWEMKKLGDLGQCLRGVSYNPEFDLMEYESDMTYSLFRSNNIKEGNLVFTDLQYVRKSSVKDSQIIRESDIVICMANGSKQLVGKSAIAHNIRPNQYTFGSFMSCYRTNIFNNPDFVYNLFQSIKYRNYIDFLLTGSNINNLNTGSIESMEFLVPNLSEQIEIAKVSNEFHGNILALQDQINKLQLQKQGMMQSLLTGKIRLV